MVRYHMTLDAFLSSAPALLGCLMHEDVRVSKGARRRRDSKPEGETIQVQFADQLPPGVL